ncbi:MAG TPA: MFS transporter [Vicinamibacteria bacterium]|nr:MFS transporter [Vicinamibacteria bacterium]
MSERAVSALGRHNSRPDPSVAALAGMFLFGIAAALLGATLPLLSERLQIGLGRVGTLFLVMNACMLASSLVLGALQDRFGMKPPLVAGPLVVGAALLVVAGAESYAQLLVAVALLGTGGSALNGASNALVADLHEDAAAKSAALNRVGLFFGFGALFIPFAIGLLLRTAGLRGILTAGAVLCALVAVANALPAYPRPKQAGGLSLAEAARLSRDPLVLLLGLLLFFQSGNEFIIGGFTTTFLTSEVGMSVRAASYALAGYWAALMLTRAWLGRGRSPLTGPRLVLASAALSALATALLVTASAVPVAVAMVFALGAALAAIFPAVLGVAGARFPAHSGTVFGLLFTMALAGGMTLPWVTGQAAAAWGLRPALGLVVLQFLAVCVLQRFALSRAGGPSAPRS